MGKSSLTPLDRLLSKARETPAGCWEWTAGRSRSGYAVFYYQGRPNRAHRVSYELLIAPIPEGLVIDHLCRNRACINPWHLEPVPNRVNILRGESFAAKHALITHCRQGHAYSEENTAYTSQGRKCIACRPLYKRRWREKRRRAKADA